MLYIGLCPLHPSRVVLVHVEPIEVPEDYGVPTRVEAPGCELLDIFVVGVVEPLEYVSVFAVENDAGVVAGGADVLAPA